MSIATLGLPSELINILQDRTLERVFHDALVARFLYRSEAIPELWAQNLGETQVATRAGLMTPSLDPLVPGTDPTPGTYSMEQWEIEANQYSSTLDTNMANSYVALAPLFTRNIQTLGINAAQSMNLVARNKLFVAYDGGNTNVTATATAGATNIHVASLAGFTSVIANARVVPVSAANPLTITFSVGGAGTNTVIAFSPDVPGQLAGPGTLFLGSALAATLTVTASARPGVYASTRSLITRVGGGTTVDAIGTGNILTLQNIIDTVSVMRANNVPPMADGYYHVHLTPEGEAQLFADAQWGRLFTALPDSMAYRDFAIGQMVGCRFYRDTENPNPNNSGTLVSTGTGGNAQGSPQIGADIYNQNGIQIRREIVLGGGVMYEKFIDESKYITDAGVTGMIGGFSVINNGVAIMTERLRMTLRAPLDRLQQIVGSTWSWSGDFGIPSDATTGGPARFKRAAVIEHA